MYSVVRRGKKEKFRTNKGKPFQGGGVKIKNRRARLVRRTTKEEQKKRHSVSSHFEERKLGFTHGILSEVLVFFSKNG